VANIINSLKLFVEILLIVEFFTVLVQRVAGGSVEPAFSSVICHCQTPD
jgi:hypothetical protein